MDNAPDIVSFGALIGDRARAEILTALMGGQALTATELAQVAGVTKQTASAHLARLLAARLIEVESQGRHRYFRLAHEDVARLLESLMGVASRIGAVRLRTGPSEPALRKARVCYDHLAGELGVLAFDSLSHRRLLSVGDDELELTPQGEKFFADLGVDVNALSTQRRSLCRPCLDWSVRRNHLAGAVGAALLIRCLELKWARRAKGSRVVNFSAVGEQAFRDRFRMTRR